MVTAESITDEQIVELRTSVIANGSPWDAQGYGPSDIAADCHLALAHSGSVRQEARARCAEIWNARNPERAP